MNGGGWMHRCIACVFQDWIDLVIAVSPPKDYEDEVYVLFQPILPLCLSLFVVNLYLDVHNQIHTIPPV